MFVNQINSKDLFTTNPMKLYGGGKDYSDSQGNSQICSQLEFSNHTGSSQDCFSQQMNIGFSQNESPQKKSYFQKYVSRGPVVFTHGSKQQSSNTNRISNKTDLESNRSRARERDERDLLYTIVNTVSQCATEVKSAVELVKENSQNANASTDKKIADFLSTLQSDLDKRYEDVVTAVGKREEAKLEIQSLREELAAKDATVNELREKVEKLQGEQDQKIVDALRDVYKEQQELNRKQIHEYHERQLRELSKQTNLQRDYQATLDSHAVHLKHSREQIQQQFLQLDARVSKEIDDYQKEQQSRYSQLTSDCQKQLQNLHREQRTELVDYFNQQLAKTNNLNTQRQQELQRLFREELESLGKQQMGELEVMIRQEVQQMTKSRQDECENILKQRSEQYREDREKLLKEIEHQRMLQQRCVSQMEKQSQAYKDTVNQQKKENEDMKKELAEQERRKSLDIQQKELEMLRRRHDQEFDALKRKYLMNSAAQNDMLCTEGSQQRSAISSGDSSRFSSHDLSNCLMIDYTGRAEPSCQSVRNVCQKSGRSPFLSPTFRREGWSSKDLFRKGGPSPLLTLSQPKKSESTCEDPQDDEQERLSPGGKGKSKAQRGKGKGKGKKRAPSRKQAKRTVGTPNVDQQRTQDTTPPAVQTRSHRRSACIASEKLPTKAMMSPEWIPKRRKAVTPSVEPVQKLKTPDWLQAYRNTKQKKSPRTEKNRSAVMEYTPPVWKKQLRDDASAWQTSDSLSQVIFPSPYSLRSYGNTPKMASGHIECSGVGVRKFQSPYGLRSLGDTSKAISTHTEMEVYDFIDEDGSITGSASYRKMTIGKSRPPSSSPAGYRPSHSAGCGDVIHHPQDESDSSQNSSPSLSVTEFVLKRKTKKERSTPSSGASTWQYMTSRDQHRSLMSPPRGDIFGSPDIDLAHQVKSSEIPTRSCTKRRLCEDDMVDTQILEITRCIKRQQRVPSTMHENN